ncbi:hypothetical protein ACMAUO_06205 [Gluconacetobacter sp. Hr-1-5]|uniref:hypothetical protein n=1 Tax=Gluconacetobacter sp. Hr-1-5 TaxID=3395370 RepID=UPI003B51D39C
MSATPLSQLQDSSNVQSGDLLLISRQTGTGWASYRAALSYVRSWLGVGKANGVAPLDGNGALVLNSTPALHVDSAGNLILDVTLPTSDPGVKNALWTQGGVLLISKGS